jgi:hypothetical protein
MNRLQQILFDYFSRRDYATFQRRLKQLDPPERKMLVNTYIRGEPLTYLSMACDNLQLPVVKFLVEKCHADTEMLVEFKDEWDTLTFCTKKSSSSPVFQTKATILWHLARHSSEDYFSIIEYLVKTAGANVNSRKETTFNSTPLM